MTSNKKRVDSNRWIPVVITQKFARLLGPVESFTSLRVVNKSWKLAVESTRFSEYPNFSDKFNQIPSSYFRMFTMFKFDITNHIVIYHWKEFKLAALSASKHARYLTISRPGYDIFTEPVLLPYDAMDFFREIITNCRSSLESLDIDSLNIFPLSYHGQFHELEELTITLHDDETHLYDIEEFKECLAFISSTQSLKKVCFQGDFAENYGTFMTYLVEHYLDSFAFKGDRDGILDYIPVEMCSVYIERAEDWEKLQRRKYAGSVQFLMIFLPTEEELREQNLYQDYTGWWNGESAISSLSDLKGIYFSGWYTNSITRPELVPLFSTLNRLSISVLTGEEYDAKVTLFEETNKCIFEIF